MSLPTSNLPARAGKREWIVCFGSTWHAIPGEREDGPAASGLAACQRKPTAPLALTSSERCHKEPFARSRPLAGRAARYKGGFLINQTRELTSLPARRYRSGHRKGRLKSLSVVVTGGRRAQTGPCYIAHAAVAISPLDLGPACLQPPTADLAD